MKYELFVCVCVCSEGKGDICFFNSLVYLKFLGMKGFFSGIFVFVTVW